MTNSNSKNYTYPATSLLMLIAFGAAIMLLFTQNGLTGKYSHKNKDLGTVVERHLTSTNGRILRSRAFNFWSSVGLEKTTVLPAYSVDWSGTITLPPLTSELTRYFHRYHYANSDFIGPPVQTETVNSLEFRTHTEKEITLRSQAIEWVGLINIPKNAKVKVLAKQKNKNDYQVYLNDKLVTDTTSDDLALTQGKWSTFLTNKAHVRVRYKAKSLRHKFELELKTHTGKSLPITPSTASKDNSYELSIKSDFAYSLRIDTHEQLQQRQANPTYSFLSGIKPGSHPIQIRLKAPHPKGSFRLYISDPSGFRRQLSPSALTPSSQSHNYLNYGLVLLGLTLFSFVVCGVKGMTFTSHFSEFGTYLQKNRALHFFYGIALLGFLLRMWQYDIVPWLWETNDEYKVAWVGWNLIHNGIPTGWSWPSVYSDTSVYNTFGGKFLLATYQFHPPPLFALLIGALATLAGCSDMGTISLSVIRIAPIALSVLSLLLTFLIAKKAFGERAALLAVLTYATLPTAAISSRLVKSESLLTVLILFSVWLLARREEKPCTKVSLLLLGGLSTGAVLVKEIGVSVGAIIGATLLRKRQIGGFLIAVLATLTGISLYCAYGWYYNWEAFTEALSFNTQLGSSIKSFLKIFTTSSVTERSVGPGWTIWLWIAATALVGKRDKLTVVALATYTIILGLTRLDMDYYGLYGWYRIPLYPFLSIGAGVFLKEMLDELDVLRPLLFVLLALTTSLAYVKLPGFFHSGTGVRVVVVSSMLPFFLHFACNSAWSEKLATVWAWVLISVFCGANCLIVTDFISLYS